MDCDYQRENLVTIDKKPLMCAIYPNNLTICAFAKDVEYCEMRWFQMQKKTKQGDSTK